MARLGSGRTSVSTVYLLGFLATALFSFHASALSFVTGSKCEAVCNDKYALTVHDDVRCLDNEFDNLPASRLKECVTCQLNSTAVDPVTRMTDVQWGLFHLRYILANCMFGYPEERVSISSPCQVSCAPLQRAVSFGIGNSTNTTNFSADLGFCTGGQFDDTTINNCAFCYTFIPQQLILGNFLQALHIACYKAPTVGNVFSPNGVTIFNQSAIAGPSDSTSSTSSGLTGTPLILAIILPLVGGLMILIGGCCCCWHLSRRRRAKMADRRMTGGHMSRYHDDQQMSNFSPMSPLPQTPQQSPPQQPFAWSEPPQEMHSISVMPRTDEHKAVQSRVTEVVELPATQHSPGCGQSRWPQHTRDESTAPLSTHDEASFGRAEDSVTAVSLEPKDSNLHEQYGSSDRQTEVSEDSFRPHDGFVKDDTQRGWAQ